MKQVALILASVAVWLMVAAFVVCTTTPAAQAIDPTLDAALYAIAQATVRAAEAQQAARAAEAAQRATAQAVSIESTRAAAQAQATATAISVQATQSALDELQRERAMTATAQWSAILATSAAGAAHAESTRQAQKAAATSQAIAIEAQATQAAKLSETYAQRQERFSLGLLVIELGMIAGALFVLARLAVTLYRWARRMEPRPASGAPSLADVIPQANKIESSVIEQAPAAAGRMPDMVQVVDDPRMVEAIGQWAEQYDAEREAANGN